MTAPTTTARAAAPTPLLTDEKSREVRVGLVLYGGVSLAIYINGVVQEFFHAVHGNGIYRLVKALTDSDIVVDVISGTSAGGINGILLAYALCNDRKIASANALWRDHGDISKLFRSPLEEPSAAASLLNSEEYRAKLENAFKTLPRYKREPDADPSRFDELDLFVTGTDVAGRVYTEIDDAGHPVDVRDHRAVFRLKHRKRRTEDLNPDFPSDLGPIQRDEYRRGTYAALAKLAQITSCFPGAFAPVEFRVPRDDAAAATDGRHAAVPLTADGKLQRWGRLEKDAYFIDGGILDNKPFTHGLGAIFSRHADRQVDRKLFYVEPDPEVAPPDRPATAPNFVQTILASVVGIRGNESIADDLKLLADRNSKLVQYSRLVNCLQPTSLLPAPMPATSGASGVPAPDEQLYLRGRLIQLSERVVRALFRKRGMRDVIPPAERGDASALIRSFDRLTERATLDDARSWLNDLDVSFRLRRLYRVVYLIHAALYDKGTSATPDQMASYRRLWRLFNRQIEVYEIVEAAMEYVLDEAPFPWRDDRGPLEADDLWGRVRDSLMMLLDDPPLLDPSKAAAVLPAVFPPHTDADDDAAWMPAGTLDELNRRIRETAANVVRLVESGTIAPGRMSLLHRLEAYERAMIKACLPRRDDIRRAYERFEELDARLFPLELIGNLYEKDVIETVRISPRDAEKGFSRAHVSEKVAGDTVYHFGGFFKRSWRSNDILWGRLDALCQIVETLLTRERLALITSSPTWRRRVREGLFADDGTSTTALDPAKLFPNAGDLTQQACLAWLRDLTSDDEDVRQAALDTDTFNDHVELLIEAAQLEVLHDNLPGVVYDAFVEQAEWNQFQSVPATPGRGVLTLAKRKSASATDKAGGSDGSTGAPATAPATNGHSASGPGGLPPWVFMPGQGRLERFTASFTSEELASQAIHELFTQSAPVPSRPTDTPLGKFFQERYRVGAEQLTRDVPLPVLMGILATALLVARNCILGTFGPKADRVRRHPLYSFGVSLPLQTFYVLAMLWRRAPNALFTILGSAVVLSLVALVAGLVWADPLLFPGGQPHVPRLVAFTLFPAIVLLVAVGLARRDALFALALGLTALGLLILGTGVVWADPLLFPGGRADVPRILALAIAPALVLLVGAGLARRRAVSAVVLGSVAAALLAVAAGTIWAAPTFFPGGTRDLPLIVGLAIGPALVLLVAAGGVLWLYAQRDRLWARIRPRAKA